MTCWHRTGSRLTQKSLVIDTATNEIVDTLTVDTGPQALAVSGNRLYVANVISGTGTVIDVAPTTSV